MISQVHTLFDGTVAYRQRTQLNGQDWILDFQWNPRTSLWYFSMLDLESAPVITGQAVVCGIEINLLQRAQGGPGGRMFALSSDGTLNEPGLLELGDRVLLFYDDGGGLDG